jgi:hypothetical protein
MYAGVGKITGLPGREKALIAACRHFSTSAIGQTLAGSTCHPWADRCQSAQAALSVAAAWSLM